MHSQPFEPSDDALLQTTPSFEQLRSLKRFELAGALRRLEAQLRMRASEIAGHVPFELPWDENGIALRRLELELDRLAGQAEVLSTIAAAQGNVPDDQLRELVNRAERATESEAIFDAYWRDYGVAG